MGFLINHKLLTIILVVLFMVGSLPCESACAKTDQPVQKHTLRATQPQLQALFIKKITKYVLGPDKRRISEERPVTVAAVSPRPMARFFNRPEEFELVRWPADCQVLFLDGDNMRVIAAILKKIKGLPILTIGSSPEFLSMGGMINLVESGSRFKLQVNVCAARQAGLTISSKLLNLSEVYCGEKSQ
ncbi:YfiR family protein [Maridesulfovibrio sp.]|uniref:YfiR family protein n=1 Tax=Maridesulfovibrio sp. TaxID=2795000 RepID=UPI002A18CCED|nr:YfiR family protein [Maridesulfovibrio sp.]